MLYIIKPHGLNRWYIFLLPFFYATDNLVVSHNVSLPCGGIYSPDFYLVFKYATGLFLFLLCLHVLVLSSCDNVFIKEYFRIKSDFFSLNNEESIVNYFKIKTS